MKPWTRWMDWLNGLVGLWFLASPWILGFSGDSAIMWTGVTLGALIAVVAVWALASPRGQIPGWTNVVLGVLAIISPWVLAFAAETTAAWNAWIVGGAAVILAAWALLIVRNASVYEQTPGKRTKAG